MSAPNPRKNNARTAEPTYPMWKSTSYSLNEELYPVCSFLEQFLALWPATSTEPGDPWQPWALPPLNCRPDPLAQQRLPTSTGELGTGPRPDLQGNDVTVVATGSPAGVLAAWGATSEQWRVVLDRPGRLGEVLAAAGSGGLITVLPTAGQIHRLPESLQLLEDLLRQEVPPAGDVTRFLPLFHWIRLVETHNGDLLDFQTVRPHPLGASPL